MNVLRVFAAASMLFALLAVSNVAQAGTLGCIVGGAGGGFGGSALGKGKGKTILTIAGALIGCGLGSNIQDNDQRRYQQPQQPQWQPQYQQRRPYRSRYNEFRYPRQQQAVVYLPAPVQTARAPQAPACAYSREYQTTVVVGGQEVLAHGRACYKPDGSWDLGPATASR